MSFQQMPRFVFTTEQKQKILYGEYFNGVDAPLKSSLHVKIARSWAREQARRKSLAISSTANDERGAQATSEEAAVEVPVPVTRALSLTGESL